MISVSSLTASALLLVRCVTRTLSQCSTRPCLIRRPQFLPQARARTAAAVKKEEEGEEKEPRESTTVKTESHEIEAPVPNAPEVVTVKKEEGAEGPPAPSASSSPARIARRGRRELA